MNERSVHLSDAHCADLVLGLCDASRRAAADAHVRECAACRERLRAHAGASVRARADAAAGVGIRLVRGRSRAWRWAAAAAVVIVAAAALLVRAPVRDPAPAWLSSPDDIVTTRAEGSLDPALLDGLRAYARRDLPAAIAGLDAARANGAPEQARRLYLGHALHASGRYERAAEVLQSLDWDLLPEPWRSDARRTLAAAWRAGGQHARADSLERTR